MGNFSFCGDCLGQPFAFNMMFWMMGAAFALPFAVGGYRRFCTEKGRKLAAKQKRIKDARKDSRKISIEVGQPKR